MASSKSSATICDLFLIFNLLFFTFGTSSLTIHAVQPRPPLATPPTSGQPGCVCHAPAPPPGGPASGNGGQGVPTPPPMTPPAKPPTPPPMTPPAKPPSSGNGGQGVPTPPPMTPPPKPPTPPPMTPPAKPPSGNGGQGVPTPPPMTPPPKPSTPPPMTPPARPPSGNGGQGVPTPPPMTPPAKPPSGNGGHCPSLDVCANLVKNLLSVTIGQVSNKPCCSVIGGLVDLDAAVCLCAALKADVLGVIKINLDIALNLILNNCGKPVPKGFHCSR